MPDTLPPDGDALTRICGDTLQEVARRRAEMPLEKIRTRAAARKDKPRGFADALVAALIDRECGLIAEIKRQSPSGGKIRDDLDPARMAREYQAGGARCLSVLTDGPHFGGSLADLQAARAAADLPVLRKDFVLDPWQVFESRAVGADCILLIMGALSDAQALELEAAAEEAGLDVLVEVHDRRELERAHGLHSKLIGINNRNLKTLKTDLQTTIELAPHVSPERLLVTESGIRSHDDVRRLAAIGVHCFLVGESLLRQPDLTAATKALLGKTQ